MLIFHEQTGLNDQYKNYLCQKIVYAPCSKNPTVASYLFSDSATYRHPSKSYSELKLICVRQKVKEYAVGTG